MGPAFLYEYGRAGGPTLILRLWVGIVADYRLLGMIA